MVDINDFCEERTCVYKEEEYLVRDNGAVLRKAQSHNRKRKYDNEWTFGKINVQTGYLEIASVRVHRIVATAFLGEQPSKNHVVDHIDTNKQNNRPENLRWVTRLENAVLNEFTRKRIEYITGVSVFEFLENPSRYRSCFNDPNYEWMRTVTEEEAKNCLENTLKWLQKKDESKSPRKPSSKIGEWIYQKKREVAQEQDNMSEKSGNALNETRNMFASKTKQAKQVDWKTPTEFVCCPKEIKENPIRCYYNNLSVGEKFAVNEYGESVIQQFVLINDGTICVKTQNPTSLKPFAIVTITFEDGYYIHTNSGSFFKQEGADKKMTLMQGLEWTGGDCFDDYC